MRRIQCIFPLVDPCNEPSLTWLRAGGRPLTADTASAQTPSGEIPAAPRAASTAARAAPAARREPQWSCSDPSCNAPSGPTAPGTRAAREVTSSATRPAASDAACATDSSGDACAGRRRGGRVRGRVKAARLLFCSAKELWPARAATGTQRCLTLAMTAFLPREPRQPGARVPGCRFALADVWPAPTSVAPGHGRDILRLGAVPRDRLGCHSHVATQLRLLGSSRELWLAGRADGVEVSG